MTDPILEGIQDAIDALNDEGLTHSAKTLEGIKSEIESKLAEWWEFKDFLQSNNFTITQIMEWLAELVVRREEEQKKKEAPKCIKCGTPMLGWSAKEGDKCYDCTYPKEAWCYKHQHFSHEQVPCPQCIIDKQSGGGKKTAI